MQLLLPKSKHHFTDTVNKDGKKSPFLCNIKRIKPKTTKGLYKHLNQDTNFLFMANDYKSNIKSYSKKHRRTKSNHTTKTNVIILDIETSDVISKERLGKYAPKVVIKSKADVERMMKKHFRKVTSYIIRESWSNVNKGKPKFHVYILLAKEFELSDIRAYVKYAVRDYNVMGLDKAGGHQKRNMICDFMIYSQERFLFENKHAKMWMIGKGEANNISITRSLGISKKNYGAVESLPYVDTYTEEYRLKFERKLIKRESKKQGISKTKYRQRLNELRHGNITMDTVVFTTTGKKTTVGAIVEKGKQVQLEAFIKYDNPSLTYYPDTERFYDHHLHTRYRIINLIIYDRYIENSLFNFDTFFRWPIESFSDTI